MATPEIKRLLEKYSNEEVGERTVAMCVIADELTKIRKLLDRAESRERLK